MNELRMYVEHLFEGRMLTAENIELKEEIYGNLVARYEDYIASGMSEAEALEKTKTSFTSLDDLREDAEPTGDEASPAGSAAGEASQTSAGTAPTRVMPAASAPASHVPSAATGSGSPAGTVPGVAQPPSGVAGAANQHGKAAMPWKRIAIIAAAVVLVLAVAAGVYEFVIDPALDRAEDAAEAEAERQWLEQQNQSSGNGQGNDGSQGNGQSAQGGTGATSGYGDAEDQREYEATKAVDDAIAAHPVDDLKSYTGNSLPDQGFFEHLPLSMYVSSTGAEQGGNASYGVWYAGVLDDIDGDAIDRALVYNAVAAFSVYPELQTVTFTVQESDETAYDANVYSFNRATLEHAFDNASGGAITQLNSSLYESQESWDQVRDYVTRNHFYDRQTDLAEIDD